MAKALRRALCAAAFLALISGTCAQAAGPTSSGPFAFASIPVKVSHSPFDSEWQRVSSAPVSSRVAEAARTLTGPDKLRAINAAVNHSIRYKEDRENWGRDDYWATAAETLAKGAGDCEDFAILKMQFLREAGVPAHNMFLVIGNDLAARQAHAMLLVRDSDRTWVLDAQTDAIHAPEEFGDFRPILSFGTEGEWVYGYDALSAPPFQIASAAGTARRQIEPAAMGGSLAATIAAQEGEEPSIATVPNR